MEPKRGLRLLLLLGLVAVGGVWLSIELGQKNDTLFQAHFLDVGQGDATLIQTPDGYEVLVDGGATSGVLRKIANEQHWSDRHIDIVIATHADQDHVGGLVDVLERYEVDLIMETEAVGSSEASQAFRAAVSEETAAQVYARAGQRIQVGASTTIDILSPVSSTLGLKSNTASIILQVRYGDTAILLTGDAPAGVEDYLVGAFGADLQSTILKLGHHGSKTSTSELFLDTVSPRYAVVSAGHGNTYNHPHPTVVERVKERNITLLETSRDGTISFTSDGQNLWWE